MGKRQSSQGRKHAGDVGHHHKHPPLSPSLSRLGLQGLAGWFPPKPTLLWSASPPNRQLLRLDSVDARLARTFTWTKLNSMSRAALKEVPSLAAAILAEKTRSGWSSISNGNGVIFPTP
jgi:hypothetical protein